AGAWSRGARPRPRRSPSGRRQSPLFPAAASSCRASFLSFLRAAILSSAEFSVAASGGATGAQPRLDVVGGPRRGEELALADAAAGIDEEVALDGVLDAFRHHVEVEPPRERDERPRERCALPVARHA